MQIRTILLIIGSIVISNWISLYDECRAETIPIMKFSEIKPGMNGKGLSVFSGLKIEEFPVEIIDTIKGFAPDRNMILSRVGGDIVEYSGIISGMSGSPVYIDGRLAGAIAYSWAFSKDPIAIVTPIEQMISIMDREAEAAFNVRTPGPAFFSIDLISDDTLSFFSPPLNKEMLTKNFQDSISKQNSAVPLVVSGCTLKTQQIISSIFQPKGFVTVAGGSAEDRENSDMSVSPGSMIAVNYISGDMTIAAVGTVTLVRDDMIFAFGHSMLNLGPISMPMARTHVHSVIPSEATSFKLSSPLNVIGTVIQDRSDGIMGRIGEFAPVLPLTVKVIHQKQNIKKEYNYQIALDPYLTPVFSYLALVNTLGSVEKSAGEAVLRIKSKLLLKDHEPIMTENIFSSYSALTMAGRELFSLFAILSNPFEEVVPISWEFDISLDDRIKVSTISEISINNEVIAPGEELKLTIMLQPYRELLQIKHITIPISEDWPEGIYRLTVADRDWQFRESLRRTPMKYQPRSLNQYIKLIIEEQDNSKMYLSIGYRNSGLTLRGEQYNNMPSSVLAIIDPSPRRGDGAVSLESVYYKEMLETDSVVSGYKTLNFRVERD